MTLNRRDALKLGAAAAAGLGPSLSIATTARAMTMSEYAYTLGGGAVSVHPVSHASLALTLPGMVAYVDPVGDTSAYESLPQPDLILVTHEHGDHFKLETLAALMGDSTRLVVNPAVFGLLPAELQTVATALGNGDGTTIGDVAIHAIPAYNSTPERMNYHPEGRDNGYVLTLDGGRVYIAGDTEDIPAMRALEGIDIAFLPMNPPYTMDIEQAASAVSDFAPKVVFPYHYRGSDTEAFAALVRNGGTATEVVLHDWYA
ncbi:MAG: MBL fold metallo-hydrolase [Alphaproteobacteria bacterium]|nr:MBL fold metallo-hydrolase [Alphaproteobacteria bacterium]